MSARLSGVPGDPAAPSSVSGAATYRGRRITSDFAARLSDFPGGQRGGLASLQVGTAVAFADGAVGISRPIGDAFVLVDRRTRYRDYSVGVNRYGTGYAAVADSLGPAVLPNVASYSPTRVSVETDTLPVGYDLGPADYDLFPGYKSGYRITVGTDATVFASGTIVDRNGDIVGLLAGRLLHLSEGTVHQFFTNRDGEFRIYGLTPGAYQLTIGSSYVGSTRIPDDTDGEIRLGRVTVVEGESGGE
jgi:outer membrane usher protein